MEKQFILFFHCNTFYLIGRSHIVLYSRRVLTGAIPSMAHHPGATECVPGLDPVSKPGKAEVCVVLEMFNNRSVGPSTIVLESLRQIPVVESDNRLYARVNESIDQFVIVESPFL